MNTQLESMIDESVNKKVNSHVDILMKEYEAVTNDLFDILMKTATDMQKKVAAKSWLSQTTGKIDMFLRLKESSR